MNRRRTSDREPGGAGLRTPNRREATSDARGVSRQEPMGFLRLGQFEGRVLVGPSSSQASGTRVAWPPWASYVPCNTSAWLPRGMPANVQKQKGCRLRGRPAWPPIPGMWGGAGGAESQPPTGGRELCRASSRSLGPRPGWREAAGRSSPRPPLSHSPCTLTLRCISAGYLSNSPAPRR